MTIAVTEETIEHITVAIINTAGLVLVAAISYLSGRRNQRKDAERGEGPTK